MKNITMQKVVLIMSHNKFKLELEERISIGCELYKRRIIKPSELSNSKEQFCLWNDYNSELLRQSFNLIDNDYYCEYSFLKKVNQFSENHRPSFQELIINYNL